MLFDGKDLSQWTSEDAQPAKWKVADGYMEVVPHSGLIHTRQPFGDCQLHVEFAEPSPPVGEDQERGNSGVFLMGLYEIQVLDSYHSKTYADGQASAVYGQFPPLVNASRPPGQWQTYDVIFHGPRFDQDGKVLRPARMTVLHNGVLVQDNVELSGPTGHHQRPPYKPTPDKLPLGLQDHGNPVRFRNIWIRELSRGTVEHPLSRVPRPSFAWAGSSQLPSLEDAGERRTSKTPPKRSLDGAPCWWCPTAALIS